MSTWFLPTISEVLALTEPVLGFQENTGGAKAQAEREWFAAIAALTQLLQQATRQPSASSDCRDSKVDSTQPEGLVLTGPCPILDDTDLDAHLQSWVFTAEPFNALPVQLPPAVGSDRAAKLQNLTGLIPLIPRDPLTAERFCLVLTTDFSLVMVLAENLVDQPGFSFSFAPETVQRTWEVLRPRILLTRSLGVDCLDALVHQLARTEPHYRIVTQFSRLFSRFLSGLPQVAESELLTNVNFPRASDSPKLRPLSSKETRPDDAANLAESFLPRTAYIQAQSASHLPTTSNSHKDQQTCRRASLGGLSELGENSDVKLIQAIAHEVRTPLTTINTLTRLLLKRADLPLEVVQRLEAIQRECAEQIDRFSLIFRAAELEASELGRSPVHLTSVSLAQVLQKSIPRWQKQAARRNLNLHVTLPQQMPAVVSDPTMLDQVLTGLIDRFTRSLAAGSHIYIQVTLAGEQLKLQLRSQSGSDGADEPQAKNPITPVLQSIGQLLMLQPETGSLSLSLPVTKNLFQALGGKLTVKKQPQRGEVLTVFLPLGPENGEIV